MRRLRGRNGPLTKESFLTMTSAAALIAASVTMAAPARADDAVNQRWIDSEFQPSTLSKADQLKVSTAMQLSVQDAVRKVVEPRPLEIRQEQSARGTLRLIAPPASPLRKPSWSRT